MMAVLYDCHWTDSALVNRHRVLLEVGVEWRLQEGASWLEQALGGGVWAERMLRN